MRPTRSREAVEPAGGEAGRERLPAEVAVRRQPAAERAGQRAGRGAPRAAGCRGGASIRASARSRQRGPGATRLALGQERAAERLEARHLVAAAGAVGEVARHQEAHALGERPRGIVGDHPGGRVPACHPRPPVNAWVPMLRGKGADGSPGRAESQRRPGDLERPLPAPAVRRARRSRRSSSAPSRPSPRARRTLAGFALRADADALRVALVAEPGGRVAGVARRPAARRARARLDFALAADGRASRRRPADAEAYVFAETPSGMPGRARPARRSGGRASPRRWPRSWATTAAGRRRRWRGLLHGIGIRALARDARGGEPRRRCALGSGLGRRRRRRRSRASSPMPATSAWRSTACAIAASTAAMSETIDRAVFTSGDAITVLPFDPRAGTVLLIEQFRRRPLGAARPAALEPRDGGRALRRDRAARGDGAARGARGGGAGARPDRADRRLLSLAGDRGRAHHRLRGRGGSRRRPAACTGSPRSMRTSARWWCRSRRRWRRSRRGEINTSPLMVSLLWLARHAERLARRLERERAIEATGRSRYSGARARAARRRR